MYYVNRQQIEQRLEFISVIIKAMEDLKNHWGERELIENLAQERTLQLAIETVTDIGSFMIDGLLMRDASSYEDIIEILYGEGVFSAEVFAALNTLVKLRKPLIQEYFTLNRNNEMHPLILTLPHILSIFIISVRNYLVEELGEDVKENN